MTGFAHSLRKAGIAADNIRVVRCLDALAYIDIKNLEDVYWVCRLSFCSTVSDLPLFGAAFESYFGRLLELNSDRSLDRSIESVGFGARDLPDQLNVLNGTARFAESLRTREIESLSEAELEQLNGMIELLRPQAAYRHTRRREQHKGSGVDINHTVRMMLRTDGELCRLVHNRARKKRRRVTVLIDVSESMTFYAAAMLRFGHAAIQASPFRTEAFTIGTRLTRITRHLQVRELDSALGSDLVIPDWHGGTRLGETLRTFLDDWGQRGMVRKAVTVIASDGWESGDAAPELLPEQVERLSRLAHCVIWVHPYGGEPGFEPLGGLEVAIPWIDHLIPGNNYVALERLSKLLQKV